MSIPAPHILLFEDPTPSLSLPLGFRRKEFRGKLAIAITANFINRNTTAEAKVEEISGVAFIFNQKFFQELREATGWCQCLQRSWVWVAWDVTAVSPMGWSVSVLSTVARLLLGLPLFVLPSANSSPAPSPYCTGQVCCWMGRVLLIP